MKMNRFDTAPVKQDAVQRTTVGQKVYDTLIGSLAVDQESPSSSIGTFVANSERRKLKALIERLLCP